MHRLKSKYPTLPTDDLHREVLAFYETKRMTTNIRNRLQQIHERRAHLADTEPIDLPG